MSGQQNAAAIRALEEQRRLAMLAADTEALEAIFDEGLIYIHSTGGRDTRASYLAKLASGAMRYASVSLDVTDILVRERFALLSGAMVATVQTADGRFAIASRYEASWIRYADRWRIAAMQSFIS
jgi:ketosteroid isomerase-like protein